LRKNSDLTEQSPQYAVGAPIESIDLRGRAATSAPLKSCLAYNAGLQDPLFHGGTRSIEAFPIQTLFGPNRVFPQPLKIGLAIPQPSLALLCWHFSPKLRLR
jgi:hypothetical protein